MSRGREAWQFSGRSEGAAWFLCVTPVDLPYEEGYAACPVCEVMARERQGQDGWECHVCAAVITPRLNRSRFKWLVACPRGPGLRQEYASALRMAGAEAMAYFGEEP